LEKQNYLLRLSLNSKGFTLAELVVTLSILGIAAAITFPVLQTSLARYTLYATARQMAAEIRALQQEALTSGKLTYQITFDTANNLYYLRLNTQTLKTVPVPPSISMETKFPQPPPKETTMEFNIKGVPTAGTIILREQTTGSFYYVIVAAVTGRVRIADTPPDKWF